MSLTLRKCWDIVVNPGQHQCLSQQLINEEVDNLGCSHQNAWQDCNSFGWKKTKRITSLKWQVVLLPVNPKRGSGDVQIYTEWFKSLRVKCIMWHLPLDGQRLSMITARLPFCLSALLPFWFLVWHLNMKDNTYIPISTKSRKFRDFRYLNTCVFVFTTLIVAIRMVYYATYALLYFYGATYIKNILRNLYL